MGPEVRKVRLSMGEVPVVSDSQVAEVLSSTVETFRWVNSLTREVLSRVGELVFDKLSIYVPTSDPDYPTKVRTMAGAWGRYTCVRSFAANERNRAKGRRLSTNLCAVFDSETTELVAVMEGNLISDFRTASIAAVGVEACVTAWGRSGGDYEASVLGSTGAVGRRVILALSALRARPRRVLLAAKSRGRFNTVRERLAQMASELDPEVGEALELVPCETLDEALSADVVVDCISLPGKMPAGLVRELGEEVIYADVGKHSLDLNLASKFDTYVFDSLDLRKMPSPATFALKIRTMLTDRRFRVLELADVVRGERVGRRVLYTVLGVPAVDAALTQAILERLGLI
ncbi:MAG: hypothetical protein QI223_08310 [Candidatus Korarchaeota archaeon]|nr:hypothetical protein [Candidatus Korarchaeota archaeon]